MNTKDGQFSELDEKTKELVNAAFETKKFAYCPYSDFPVGCAVLTKSDEIFTGANVENASYGLSICAERVAVMNAVSRGHRNFKSAAITCNIVDCFKAPCGACRQFFITAFMSDSFISVQLGGQDVFFGLDWFLYMLKPEDKSWRRILMRDLVPLAFTPNSLEQKRI